jgi:predicted permease
MLSTLSTVLPIFALIFAGWLVRRIGVLGSHATTELNRFVVYLALPALLFDIIAHTHGADIWQPGFIAVFGISSVLVFGLTLLIRLRGARPLADATIDGLNAGYANTGFMGFPLALVAIGRETLAPTVIATIITVCAIFAVAIVLIEAGLQAEKRPGLLALKVCRSLIRNPLLVAPAVATLFPVSGLAVPDAVESFLKLLGGAASPCALVALGLFLAQKQEKTGASTDATALLVGFKLVLHPLVTWLLAAFVFELSPLMTHTAVLLSALPTGTGPFMLAEFYRREARVTSRVILVSTIISILTVSAYLAWVAPSLSS